MKNTKAKYLLEDIELYHLAYTLGSGAASGMNEAYILKADETEITEEEQELLDEIVKGVTDSKVETLTKDSPRKFFPENVKSLENEDSDAMSESVNKTADIGTNNKEETQVMSDNLTQADLQKALEEARIEWAKEQEIKDLTKSKTETFGEVAFLKGNDDLVVDLAKSVVEGNDIVEQLINKANEHIASIEKAHEEALAKEVAAKEEIKKNFGEEKTSITEELKEETAGKKLTNQSIIDRVAEIKKAQQNA